MNQTIADLGEFGLIEQITSTLVRGPAVSVGPGDDGAVFLADPPVVASTDVLVEHVHFRRDWVSAYDVGRKAVAVSVSDIEAMGATPVAVLVAFTAPRDLEAAWAIDCMNGIAAECDTARASLVGGDVSSGGEISLAMTIIGSLHGGSPLKRGGAQPGDAVALRGRLGWAAAGLTVLSRGFRSPRAVVHAYQCPEPPYGAGAEAAGHAATSLIDISDGLIADLGHVAAASHVVIDIDTARLLVPDPLVVVAQATGKDPLDFVLTGGEDHALVATFPWGEVPKTWSVIGEVGAADTREPGVLVDGAEWVGPGGWSHFV
ncbi:MAG: thiamine-phosphate kinase [Propionibacteriaceae bacterium]|jgi:thiamine-monophosphate kinase|nr:thiamine-phosphate kinase [Propionibacteriaceae bacterium]